MNQAALAHLGERQTEVHFESRLTSDFWRYCVRSTEAAVSFAFFGGRTERGCSSCFALKGFLVIEITVWMEMQRGLVCELIDFEVCVSWRGSSLKILSTIRCHYTQFSGVETRIERSE